MEGNFFDATETYPDSILLTDSEGNEVFMQGEDSEQFRQEWEEIIKIWTRCYGPKKSFRKKPFGPFKSYQEHFDAIADPYFPVKGE